MAESSIAGLFQDPLLYQQAQDQTAFKRFAEMAQLEPLQQAQAGLMYGGYQAGGALGRALGGEDPMLQQLSLRNQLASQFGTSSAEGWINISNALREKGDLAGSFMASQKALEARKAEADIQAKTAEKLTSEQKNSAAYADTVATRGTPEWSKAYQEKLQEMTTKPEGRISYGPEADRLAKAVYGKNFNQLSQAEAAIVDKTLEQRGLNKAAATRSSINLPPQEKAEQGERGKMLVDIYKDISKQAGVAARTLPALETSLNILDKGFDTGFGTETIAAGAKVLAAFGVKDAEKFATNSQAFLGAASQAVLTRQLEQKGPQTEADASRITQTGAQLGNTKEANRFLISVAKAQFKRDLAQRKFFDDWFEKNKTYDGAENAWYNGQGGKSLFEMPELQKYTAPVSPAAQIPTISGPIYASNGKQRIVSTDGGRTWKPVQ